MGERDKSSGVDAAAHQQDATKHLDTKEEIRADEAQWPLESHPASTAPTPASLSAEEKAAVAALLFRKGLLQEQGGIAVDGDKS